MYLHYHSPIKIFLPACLLLFSIATFGQHVVSGKVVSAENQQPVLGATITVKNSKKQTTTDNFGIFNIEAKNDDTLLITNIGFVNREIKGHEAALITLPVDPKTMNEVL